MLPEIENNESGISRQLDFTVPSEAFKERPIISLFSKIQSTCSDQNHKGNDTDVSKKSPIFAVSDVIIQNNQLFAVSGALDGKQTLNARDSKAGMPVPTKCDVDMKTEFRATENQPQVAETQYEKFQIPSSRRLPSSNRRLVANDMKKCRSALENEFRSQKVLFTTPFAVSRPIINLMNNVRLDDSLDCYKSSPVVLKSSPENTENSPTLASNNEDYVAMNPDEMICIEQYPKIENESVQDDDKSKIVRINGKEFVVHKKIGHGGSSSVFSAEHKDRKLECALKVY